MPAISNGSYTLPRPFITDSGPITFWAHTGEAMGGPRGQNGPQETISRHSKVVGNQSLVWKDNTIAAPGYQILLAWISKYFRIKVIFKFYFDNEWNMLLTVFR